MILSPIRLTPTVPVIVVDDKGANLADARVSLVEKEDLDNSGTGAAVALHPFPDLNATHDFDKGVGVYKEKAPIPSDAGKDWVLVVSLAGKAPVVQRLTLKRGSAGELTALPQPRPVATVTITNMIRKVGASKVKQITFHVTLFPAAELVFIAGVDYRFAPGNDISKGNLFHEYASDRAKILRFEKKIHAGTIVTVFSTAEIWRKKQVFGIPRSDGVPTLVDIEVVKLWGDPKKRVIPKRPALYQPLPNVDIHINDFYDYIAEAGGRDPKSVNEIGIFSHSHPNGPILYNTNDPDPLSADRGAKDFDARAKDFNDKNFPPFAGMLDAFAPGCRFRVWGCNATTHSKKRSAAALDAIQKGQDGDTFFFKVRTELKEHGHTVIEEERLSEFRHRVLMDRQFRANFVYAAAAAKRLNIEVRAGCPGTSTDVLRIDKLCQVFKISLATYKPVYDYFHKKFPAFAETSGKWDEGFVDYHALQKPAAIKEPPFSSEYYLLNIEIPPDPHGVGGTLMFWNGKFVAHLRDDVTVDLKPAALFGTTGHLFLLTLGPTFTMGFYAQEDGHIFGVDQDSATHAWTVKGAEVL
jgi:hypothetical protein